MTSKAMGAMLLTNVLQDHLCWLVTKTASVVDPLTSTVRMVATMLKVIHGINDDCNCLRLSARVFLDLASVEFPLFSLKLPSVAWHPPAGARAGGTMLRRILSM